MVLGITLTAATFVVIGMYSLGCFMTALKFERAMVRNKSEG